MGRGSDLVFAPFGEVRVGALSSLTDFGYTGQRHDPSTGGLVYYGSRYYLPGLKRFISPDTIVPNPINPQDWNRYAYVLNNPVNFTDPTGHAYIMDPAEWSFASQSSKSYTSGAAPKPVLISQDDADLFKPEAVIAAWAEIQEVQIIVVGKGKVTPGTNLGNSMDAVLDQMAAFNATEKALENAGYSPNDVLHYNGSNPWTIVLGNPGMIPGGVSGASGHPLVEDTTFTPNNPANGVIVDPAKSNSYTGIHESGHVVDTLGGCTTNASVGGNCSGTVGTIPFWSGPYGAWTYLGPPVQSLGAPSKYALTHPKEYFAESWVVYICQKAGLPECGNYKTPLNPVVEQYIEQVIEAAAANWGP